MGHWSIEREGNDVAVVIFKNEEKEMNTFSESVIRELDKVIDKLAEDSALKGVVFISGRPDQFIVGADIEEIQRFTTAEEATKGARAMSGVFEKLDTLKVSSVAAIDGNCLGGGLEFSLACTWRVVTDSNKSKLGLPEIQLGLIPGAGGTQRLPRLIGIQGALDLILTGKRLNGKRAFKAGLVDACVPQHLLREQAVEFATRKRKPGRRIPEFSVGKLGKDLPKWATEGNPLGRKVVQKKAKEMIDDKTKGFYPASYKALEAVFEGYDMKLSKALDLEANLFGQLALTRESHSLVHLFHATTAIKKHGFKDAGKERFGDRKISKIGILGAGFMGAGLATVCADRGIRAVMSDPNKESMGRLLKHARDYYLKKLKRRRLKPFELDQRMAHISAGLTPAGFDRTDMVVEAVFEDLELKRQLLKDLESQGGEDFIFASNTSAIPIGNIAEGAADPSRVIGMHFFSPVEKMPLLEIIITDKTAPWVTARAIELGNRLGKQIIVVNDSPGFYTTRCLAFFLAEAATILLEGAKIEQIDGALTDFGFPVGPITLIDEVGIDVGIHVLETVESAFPDRMTAPKGLKPIADSGRLGRKNNKGFYTYDGGKKGSADSAIYDLLGSERPKSANVEADEIVDRCMLLFVNESVRCLEEGILRAAYDGDVGAVFGLGFPPFWGGPFKYVDHIGAKVVVERLSELVDKYGPRFKPAEKLVAIAAANEKFFPEEP